MKTKLFHSRLHQPRLTVLGLAISQLFLTTASAQGVATDKSLETIVVTGTRSSLDPNLPTTTESKTAEQLREQNFVNVEDALKYMPNVAIRKRYIGDRNSLIGGRSSSNLQAPRGLVYADGYLLSQFLGQFNAPRWNVVAPEELERVDVLYGPYSAIYPGNSIGTTVVMTTRQPKKLESSAKLQYFTQHYDDAGYSDTYGGHQLSAWLGDKVGDWSYSIGANRLKNNSQPMQYVTLQGASGALGPATPVTGAVPGLDPSGVPWLLVGSNGTALENSTQEQIKLKAGYDFSSKLYGEILYSYWRNDSRRHGISLLRDAVGNPVDRGIVEIGGIRYSIPETAFSPQNVEESHGFLGLKLTSRNKTGWNASAVVTLYDITTDLTRSSTRAPSTGNTSGTLSDASGTGWKTLDLQGTYTPAKDEAHALSFGYHSNRYRLESRVFSTSDWLNGGPEGLSSGFFGKTSLQALFFQDAWKISSKWRSTLGLRYEEWKAYDGSRVGASSPYANRKISAWSPKVSVSYLPNSNWILKGSIGKGVRFPTVSELFQGSVVAGNIVNNDPNLRPEYSLAKEFTVERAIEFGTATGTVRVSIFEDDVRDTILSQRNILVTPNVTNIQNIDRVRTRGIELSASTQDLFVKGFELTGNLAFTRSVILENTNNPATVGNRWVRVPKVRGSLIGTYRPSEKLTTSLAVRHSGHQYGTLENTDINPNTYGGVSSYTVWDAKVSYKISKHIEASFGIDNLTNRKYWVFHPYPGRSFFGEIRGSF